MSFHAAYADSEPPAQSSIIAQRRSLNRDVANTFVTEVEGARGSASHALCSAETKLVAPKLEMVRAGGLFYSGAAVLGIRWINRFDRF